MASSIDTVINGFAQELNEYHKKAATDKKAALQDAFSTRNNDMHADDAETAAREYGRKQASRYYLEMEKLARDLGLTT